MEFNPKPVFIPDDGLIDEISENLQAKKDFGQYFLARKRGVIRNPEYRKFMGGKSTVYEHIWANLVRRDMYNDRHNIKRNYYDKGFLAYCSTYRHIAKECYMDRDTVQDYVKEFEALNIIKTEKIGPKPTKKDKLGRLIDRRRTVFILGTWHKEVVEGKELIQERYYMDDVFYK